MAIVVPGRGWTAFMRVAQGVTEYQLLGPFAVGAFLRRLWVSFAASEACTVDFGATLGASSEASQAGFAAGSSLIDRSDAAVYGQPIGSCAIVAGLSPQLVVPCGRQVFGGARYVVVYGLPVGGESAVEFLFSMEVMERTRTHD